MSDGTAAKTVESADEPTAKTTGKGDRNLRLLLVSFDLLLLVVVVLGTTGTLATILDAFGISGGDFPVTVEWYIYAFAVLGALGYVFTKLVKDPNRSFGSLVHANIRLPAALPLAAGFYLLAGQFLGSAPPENLLAGVAFLTGLFVNIAYKRIGALATRLLPTEKGGGQPGSG